MPPCGDREEGKRNAYANHQRDERRVEFMIHRHDACPDHWTHRRLEYRDAQYLPLRAQHAQEEEQDQRRADHELEQKPDDQRPHLARRDLVAAGNRPKPEQSDQGSAQALEQIVEPDGTSNGVNRSARTNA